MTTFKLTRDITGAYSNVLPITSDVIEINDDIGGFIDIPSEYNQYVAEIVAYPSTGDISFTRLRYYEDPINNPAKYSTYISPYLSFDRLIKGGSKIRLDRARSTIDPATTYKIYLHTK